MMWLLYDWLVAVIINIVLGFYLYFFVSNGMQLIQELYMAETETVDS